MNKYFYPIFKSNLKPWIKYWLIKRLSGEGESELKVVTISSGKLLKVDKTKPLSVKEYYGNTIQDGTPTPEAPIEVQTISGDNEIFIGSNTYKLNLVSNNLYKGYANLSSGWLPGSGAYPTTNSNYPNAKYQLIELEEGKSITVSNSTSSRARIRYIDKDTNQVMGTVDSVGESASSYYITTASFDSGFTNGTITAKKDFILGILIFEERVDTENVMLNEGSSALPYEPYYNYELCKIGDYQDKIINDNGTWKLEKNVGKVVLNGSENWQYNASYSAFYIGNNTSNGQSVLSNYFKGITSGILTNDNAILFNTTTLYVIYHSLNGVVADLKTWLGNNNTSVYYPLATPTTETITNTNLISQLEALGNVTVSSSTVAISNDSEIPFEMKIEYYGR